MNPLELPANTDTSRLGAQHTLNTRMQELAFSSYYDSAQSIIHRMMNKMILPGTPGQVKQECMLTTGGVLRGYVSV